MTQERKEVIQRALGIISVLALALAACFAVGWLTGCAATSASGRTFNLTEPTDSLFTSALPAPEPPVWMEGPTIHLGRHIQRFPNADIVTDFWLTTSMGLVNKEPKPNADLAGGES